MNLQYGPQDEFLPSDIVVFKNLVNNSQYNGKTGVIKKRYDESRFRVMVHDSSQELAMWPENMELLKNCQHKRYPMSHPIIIWPDVCKTDVPSIQTIEMYPELLKAAENYYNLIFKWKQGKQDCCNLNHNVSLAF